MRRRRRKQRGAKPTGKLRITSMMDILTVLLLFLLKSFVADGENMTPAPGVELPKSTSTESTEASLVVAISENDLTIGGEPVAQVAQLIASDRMLIDELASRLDAAREKREHIAAAKGETVEEVGQVTIQGDREIPFEVLQKVMFTCQQSGYGNISLAVIQNS